MFRKPVALKIAGVLGLCAGLFYVLFAMDFSTQVLQVNPYANQDWRTVMEETASSSGPLILTQLLGFAACMLLVFFIGALAVRAGKAHPTLAGMGGLFMGAAVGMFALRSMWIAFVQVPMAITFHGVTDQAFRDALVNQYRVDVFASLFFAWGYILFMTVGLFLMTGALIPVKALAHVLPVIFGLAAVACASFVPALAYVGNQIYMNRLFEKELASGFFFAVWFLPGLAFAAAGAWLLREGMTMEAPIDTVEDLHLEKVA